MEDVGPCRNGFEGKLSALSQFQTDEANALMTRALTAMDMMNNAIELQNEVKPVAGAMLGEQVCLEVASSVASDQRCPPDMIDNAIDRHPGWLCTSAVGLGDAVLTAASLHMRHDALCHAAAEQQELQHVSVFLGGVPTAAQSSPLHWSSCLRLNRKLSVQSEPEVYGLGMPGTSLPTAAILHTHTAPSSKARLVLSASASTAA